ncbi:hypothetical protein D9I56_23570 [Escherichia coli]|nr:hypothetical protein [Escherichia coli]
MILLFLLIERIVLFLLFFSAQIQNRTDLRNFKGIHFSGAVAWLASLRIIGSLISGCFYFSLSF